VKLEGEKEVVKVDMLDLDVFNPTGLLKKCPHLA
jgi:hypothetical protein